MKATNTLPDGTAAGVGDRELLDRFIAGRDETAFACLVQRHSRTVWGLCRRVLRHEQEADDAYQAVFIVLSRKAASIRKGEAVGSWLYKVAYRIALKARLRLHRHRELEKQTAPPDIAFEDSPLGEAALREMQRILDEEVDRLTDKFRAPFVLCCLEGMSKPEAASELGCSEATVKARLVQARKILKGRLAGRGITLSAALTAVALGQAAASAAPPSVLAVSTSQAASETSLALAESFVPVMGMAKLTSALAVCLATILALAGAAVTAFQNVAEPRAVKAAAAVSDPETFLAPPAPLLKVHDEQVLALALSPDGQRLVTAGARPGRPGQFMIWDVPSHQAIVRLRGITGIRGVAFAPDGKTVACSTFGKTVDLRDAETGQERAVLAGHKRGVNAVAFSADGNLLASAGLDSVVKLWDVQKLAEKNTFSGHTDMVFAVALFADGKTMVSGSKDRTARIWDIDSGTSKLTLACPQAVEAVAVSPDDSIVATGSWDQTIRLWDAATGREEAALACPEGLILGLAFSPDGTLLASTLFDGSTRIWDVKTRQTIRRLAGHTAAAWGVAFGPDGKILATGSTDRTARLWEVETGMEIGTLQTAEQQPVQALAYAPDGNSFAVAGRDKSVQVRDAVSGELRRVLSGHTDVVNCVAISPDGSTLASGSSDKTIKLWNLATGTARSTIRGHSGAVLALAFAPDGTLASAGEDGLIKWWDRPNGRGPITFQGHGAAVRALAFAPDGSTLASGGEDRDIRIWSLARAALERVRPGHASAIRALAFAPDGILASAGDNGEVMLWGRGADTERSTLAGHAGAVPALAFTPRGTLVSGGEDGLIFVWDPATGRPRAKLAGHNSAVRGLAVHPKGDHLVSGSDDALLLRWRSATAAAPAGGGLVAAAGAAVAQPAAGDLHVPLTTRPDNLPRMQFVGRHAAKCLQFEPAGMHITVPPGLTGIDAHAVLSTGVRLNGDFEATVNFEILHLPEPDEAGPETGITMSVRCDKADLYVAGATRRVVKKGGPHFSAWCTWFEFPGKPSKHEEQLTATTTKSGRLRLSREGDRLSYYASTSPDAELVLLNRISIGTRPLHDLRLLGFTGDPRASLDARFWDLHIRGASAPAAVAAADNEAVESAPTKSRSKLWLAAGAMLGCVFALLCGLTLMLRRNRSA